MVAITRRGNVALLMSKRPAPAAHSGLSVDFAPLRPSTETYTSREVAAWWASTEFPITQSQTLRMRFLNLQNAHFEVGALERLILPIARQISSGAHGPLALGVVSSDQAVENFVSYLAKEHKVPLFIAASATDPETAEPAGGLTRAEHDTLRQLREFGGVLTSSEYAAAANLEAAAASNRLTALVKKGYLFRVSRPRGDLFVDPRLQGESRLGEDETERQMPTLEMPTDIARAITVTAKASGRSPEDVLSEAWEAYASRPPTQMSKLALKAHELEDEPGEAVEDPAEIRRLLGI